MNKSIELRMRQLEARMTALEAKAAKPVEVVPPVVLQVVSQPTSDRKMCPKCGVKPNHFFHVKNCTGQKDGDTATDRRRDKVTT